MVDAANTAKSAIRREAKRDGGRFMLYVSSER
jgi:hypothetical protein